MWFINFLKKINHRHLGILGIVTLIVGLLLSRVLISVGMIILMVNAVFNVRIATNARQYFRNPALLAITSIFVMVLMSGLYSENLAYFMDRMRIKLPFLLLPFSIVAIPKFNRGLFYGLLYFFFWLMVGVCLYSMLQYLQDFEAINLGYKEGQVIPTPIMHIRFSLLVVIAFVCGLLFYGEKYYWKSPLERSLVLAFTIFLFLYVHILAVRTGLVALYGVVLVLIFRYIILNKRFYLGFFLVLSLMLGGYGALQTLPTLQNKVGYMLYSLDAFRKGENLAVLSDSYRLANIEAGIHIGNQSMPLGVGMGDLLDETQAYLINNYPDLAGEIFLPQSQYVVVYAGMGVVGLLLFLWATNALLWYRSGYRHFFMVGFTVIMTLAFVVGHLVEVQRGTALFLIFTLMGIRYLEDEMIRL